MSIDKRLTRLEYIVWYIAGSLSIGWAKDLLPIVSAMIGVTN